MGPIVAPVGSSANALKPRMSRGFFHGPVVCPWPCQNRFISMGEQ